MGKLVKTKKKLIKTIDIEVAIAKYFGIGTHIIVPNISWGFDGMHECDLFVLKKSGYAAEVEIKISKADFMKDFQKAHQHVDPKNRIAHFYYAMPDYIYDKVKDMIPKNAGIFVCSRTSYDTIRVRCERSAKKIKNSRKLTLQEQFKIARLGTLRIWKLKETVIKLKEKC